MKTNTLCKLTLAGSQPRQLTSVLTLERQPEMSMLPERTAELFRRHRDKELTPMPPLPPPRYYGAERTSGWVSRIAGQHLTGGNHIEIELPFGTGRYIPAKALRRLLGGRRGDALLKLVAGQWIICDDHVQVDLTDTNTQFRVGPIAVYS
jgi:hypothetical protein